MPRTIAVKGFVTIKQDDKIIAHRKRNHFVDAGLKGLISTLIFERSIYDITRPKWYLWASSWNMYIGSDVATTTLTTHTELLSPIGAVPGTAPDSTDITTTDGSGDGIWEAIYHATWNAGTVPAVTLGEAALYLKAPDKTTFQWEIDNTEYNPSQVMVSRLSDADADFSSIVIDDTVPLTIDWTVQFSFA